MSFVDVQNQLYNAMCDGLQQSPDRFQILQPAPPLSKGEGDTPLWTLFNNIPPLSLNQNYVASGGNQLFSDFSALMGALKPASSIDVKKDIGEDNFIAFTAYLGGLKPTPPVAKYSEIFFSWAMQYAPDVAQIGAADYAAIVLDPILSAQFSLLTYKAGKLQPDWARGYKDMVRELADAPTRTFKVDSSTTSSNVSHTWASGQHSGLFGLWEGSSTDDQVSQQFASSSFRVEASFEHLLLFQTNAGAWYESAALGLAYHNQGDPPWRTGSAITWENTFGIQGNMQRFAINLLVADTMNIVVKANTTYSELQQQTIIENKKNGLWPFYTSSSTSGMESKVEFDDTGAIMITTTSAPTVPVVIGVNVLPISSFVGFAVSALEKRAMYQA
ncbi:hypothetical protein [Kitasatospora sp. NPDC088346]|uniref:hypothetical protein n=1 Tax=Kitasatospora sp. NPDC088346 TaxID=3364073 RepID=UPI0037F94C9D